MLEARSLTCVRDGRRLFSDLSFAVSAGDIVQIEGPNGAGKTSLLRILAGLHYIESGGVRWQQHDIRQQRTAFHAELLFIGHLAGIKTLLTPLENLSFFHPGQDEEALWRALDAVGLPGCEEVPLAQLSAGQQRRVALARLWLSRARLWILDEPLTAIDRAGVAQLMTKFIRHAEQGGMVVLTTHQHLPDEDYPVRKICLHNGEEA